jgi:hypothetical protein
MYSMRPYECDNCAAILAAQQLQPIKHYSERVDEGGDEPDGECPECGSLAYEIVQGSERWKRFVADAIAKPPGERTEQERAAILAELDSMREGI